MFTDVGWGEILVILVAAVIIFGPDKLPKLAADLAKGLRMVRNWAQHARAELDDELPAELKGMDLASLNPKTFVRKALLEDDPIGLGEPNGTNGSAAHRTATKRRLEQGQPAPYDTDAT